MAVVDGILDAPEAILVVRLRPACGSWQPKTSSTRCRSRKSRTPTRNATLAALASK